MWSKNLDIVFFVYGLSFFIMGIAILIQPRKRSVFRLSDILWLLAGFGLIHGINEWLDMFAIIKGYNADLFNTVRLAMLGVSYIFLFEFGRRLILLCFRKFLNKWVTVILCFIIAVFIFVLKQEPAIWPRYLLGFPGGLLSALGFIFYYRCNEIALNQIRVRPYFLIATFFLGVYGVLGGIVVPKANFPPASIINTASFLELFGIPVQAARCICAIVLSWSVWRILAIFNWEQDEKLKKSLIDAAAAKNYIDNILKSMIDSVIILDTDAKIKTLNPAAIKLLGYEKNEFVGIPVNSVFTEQGSLFEGAGFQRLIKEAPMNNYETLCKTKSGNPVCVLVSVSIMKGDGGKPEGLVITAKDITERKQIEDELKCNHDIENVMNSLLRLSVEDIPLEEFLKRALDLIISFPLFLLGPQGSIFLAGDKPGVLAMRAHKGLHPLLEKICSEVPFGRCLCGRAALTGKMQFSSALDERHEVSYEGIAAHGHYCVPIISSGRILGVLNLYLKEGHRYDKREEDFLFAVSNTLAGVIERKKAEEELRQAYTKLQETQDQLIQAEKLNAVGQLASGVAHEVRNPLGIIMQGVNYLENKVSSQDTLEVLGMVKDSVKRADKIIGALLGFSRVTGLNLQPEDINSILEESLVLVRNQFKFEDINVCTETKDDLPKVLVDKNRIEQVFVNIFLNAAQAMPEKGKIIIRSYAKELKEVKNGTGRREDDHFKIGEKAIIVEIEDTGMGIPEESLKRIFDPFFTTKGPHGGTGLGLSVSRNIINMHQGLIEVKSQIGKGTNVIITFKIAGG